MAQFHYLTSTLFNALINIKFSDHYVDPRGNLRSKMDIELCLMKKTKSPATLRSKSLHSKSESNCFFFGLWRQVFKS